MSIPESTTNMQNPFAAEKRMRRLEEVLPDLRERQLPPVVTDVVVIPGMGTFKTETTLHVGEPKPEPILQVCLPMTYSEYTAVTGFLAEYRERFKAQEST